MNQTPATIGKGSLLYELTPDQVALVEKFRGLVELKAPFIENKTLPYLARWMVARNFEQEKALQMLTANYNWRIRSLFAFQLRDLKREDKLIANHIPGGMFGRSKLGNLVYYAPMGLLQPELIRNNFAYRDFLNDRLKQAIDLEQEMQRVSLQSGELVDQCYIVMDLEGMKFSEFLTGDFSAIMLTMAQMVADNFPEMLAKVFILNGPKLMSMLFKLFSTVLTERIRSKIHILAPETSRDELLVHIDADQLPKYYGGEVAVPDERCSDKILWPKPFANDHYARDLDRECKLNPKTWHHIKLKRGMCASIPFQKSAPGAKLSWKIQSDTRDVQVGLSFRAPGATEKEMLCPVLRLNTQIMTDCGSFVITEHGDYFLELDNRNSFFQSKDVNYQIKTIPFAGQDQHNDD